MKIILTLIVVAVIGFVGFNLLSNEATAPTTENTTTKPDTVESGQLAPDAPDEVSDMEVEEMVETEAEEEETTPAPVTEEPAEEKVFTIDAFSFGYSEDEIRVNQGDVVTINLTNSNGFHDWVVDEFDAATEKIQAGDTTSVTFVADQTGTFEYYCSVGNHRAQGMVGTLIVE